MRRLRLFFLLMMTVCLWALPAAAYNSQPIVYGDLQGDQVADRQDARAYRTHLVNSTTGTLPLPQADVNADGRTDAQDCAILERHAAFESGIFWPGYSGHLGPGFRLPLEKSPAAAALSVSDCFCPKGSQRVKLVVSVDQNPGVQVSFLKLSYDHTALQFVSAAGSESGLKLDRPYDRNSPLVLLYGSGDGAPSSSDQLLTLTFHVLKRQPALVSIEPDSQLLADTLEPIPFTAKSGRITFEPELELDHCTMTVQQASCVYGSPLPACVLAGKPSNAGNNHVSYTGILRKDGSSYESSQPPTQAGSYVVHVQCQTETTIYQAETAFTIFPKPVSHAVITLGLPLTYNGRLQTQTVAKVWLDGEDLTDLCVITDNTAINAGDYEFNITASDASNYTGSVPQAFSIKRRCATVTPHGGQFKSYGADDPDVFLYSADLLPGDTLQGALKRLPGEFAGFYGFTLGTLRNLNYSLAVDQGVYFIIRAVPDPAVLPTALSTYCSQTIDLPALLSPKPFGALTCQLLSGSGRVDEEGRFTAPAVPGQSVIRLTIADASLNGDDLPEYLGKSGTLTITSLPTAGAAAIKEVHAIKQNSDHIVTISCSHTGPSLSGQLLCAAYSKEGKLLDICTEAVNFPPDSGLTQAITFQITEEPFYKFRVFLTDPGCSPMGPSIEILADRTVP